MNLQENIRRIQEMMGLNESFLDWFKSPKSVDIGDEVFNKSEENRFTCYDCGEQDYNMYMVNDDLWKKYGNEKLTLCKSCLEKRMGRKLTKKDISQHKDALVNKHNPEMMGLNENLSPWFKRRFDIDELDDLIKDVKDQIEEGESLDTAIYDTVRQFIATKRFSDINDTGTEQQYWDSYLRYERPMIEYVKERLGID